jgi:hypothetical protein
MIIHYNQNSFHIKLGDIQNPSKKTFVVVAGVDDKKDWVEESEILSLIKHILEEISSEYEGFEFTSDFVINNTSSKSTEAGIILLKGFHFMVTW